MKSACSFIPFYLPIYLAMSFALLACAGDPGDSVAVNDGEPAATEVRRVSGHMGAIAALSAASASELAERRCATRSLTASEAAQLDERVARFERSLQAGDHHRPEHIVIPVAFHVLHAGDAGLLSQADIDDQMAVLNQGFATTPFRFSLMSVDYTDNADYFAMNPYSDIEQVVKNELHVGDARVLNLYSASPSDGYLGWSSLPWDYAANPIDDGVVLLHSSLPGGAAAPYNEGDTAIHEIGHWLGLYHTFEEGCSRRNDRVYDTPAESEPAIGCPVGRDTCQGGGLDPVHNFMNYVDDDCMDEFTFGQKLRMLTSYLLFRFSPL